VLLDQFDFDLILAQHAWWAEASDAPVAAPVQFHPAGVSDVRSREDMSVHTETVATIAWFTSHIRPHLRVSAQGAEDNLAEDIRVVAACKQRSRELLGPRGLADRQHLAV
jgi:hypothetical protein